MRCLHIRCLFDPCRELWLCHCGRTCETSMQRANREGEFYEIVEPDPPLPSEEA